MECIGKLHLLYPILPDISMNARNRSITRWTVRQSIELNRFVYAIRETININNFHFIKSNKNQVKT